MPRQKHDISRLQQALLDWYRKHRRVMPWRATGKRRPDPYHVWLSEIMLQQTTVVTVGPYFERFIARWPTIEKLAAAKLDDALAQWAGLGYYARARNLHKCAQLIAEKHGGKFPESVDDLLQLPGIGPYTAAAVSSIAFNHEAVAVDGNVERVVSRFFAIDQPMPGTKKIIRKKVAALVVNNAHPSDFTQALMELGATVCTPRAPKCPLCPWQEECHARKRGIAESLPRKAAKKVKPLRFGKVFWIEDAKGRFLIEKRLGKGLYEGLYQLPTTEWIENKSSIRQLKPPYPRLRFQAAGEDVRHSFTHFDLVLEIWVAKAPGSFHIKEGKFITIKDMRRYALPTLMQKAVRLCLGRKIT